MHDKVSSNHGFYYIRTQPPYELHILECHSFDMDIPLQRYGYKIKF